MMKDTMYEKGP